GGEGFRPAQVPGVEVAAAGPDDKPAAVGAEAGAGRAFGAPGRVLPLGVGGETQPRQLPVRLLVEQPDAQWCRRVADALDQGQALAVGAVGDVVSLEALGQAAPQAQVDRPQAGGRQGAQLGLVVGGLGQGGEVLEAAEVLPGPAGLPRRLALLDLEQQAVEAEDLGPAGVVTVAQ